jgi:hypothetical protein
MNLIESVNEFLESPPTSDLAKQWIENEQLSNNVVQKESLDDLFDDIFGSSINEIRPILSLSEVKQRQQKICESMGLSIKGTDTGLSMNASGESIGRDTGETLSKFMGKARSKSGKNKVLAKEAIGADGGAIANSISAEKDIRLKHKGITVSTWKANRSISS